MEKDQTAAPWRGSDGGQQAGSGWPVLTVRFLIDAFNRRDLKLAFDLTSPGVQLDLPGVPGNARTRYRGHDGLRALCAHVEAARKELRLALTGYQTLPDAVAISVRLTGSDEDGEGAIARETGLRVRFDGSGSVEAIAVDDDHTIAPASPEAMSTGSPRIRDGR
jgi:hypothetical protein